MLMFIGGHPRSGTTMLKEICTSHPQVRVTGEYKYLRDLGEPFTAYAASQLRITWQKGASGMRSAPEGRGGRRGALRRWRRHGAFTARLLSQLRERGGTGAVDASRVEAALRTMFPGTRVVGDKWPGYERYLERLLGFPGVTGILILRDGRDVVGSALRMARTNWRGQEAGLKHGTAERAAGLWVESVEILERYRDRVHVVRYEDLVCQPEEGLEELATVLDVDPKGFRADIARTTSIGRHRESLTAEELRTVMELAGPALERYGYV